MKVNYNLLSVSGGGGVGSKIEGLSDEEKRVRLIAEIKLSLGLTLRGFLVMPEAFHVSSITIRKKSARESELARQKLLGLRKRIVEGGVPFDEVARQNSEDTHAAEGGDMGWISRGDFIPQLEEAIFRLKPKEVTPVLESDIGWHLFRLEEHRAKKTKTFEETKEQIEGYLYSEKSRKRFEEWVARLRKDAYISIR
jgi:parvulin-like peptidyl-prolyl isomerase